MARCTAASLLQHLVLARGDEADQHDHAAFVGLADQPFQPPAKFRLQFAVGGVAVGAGVDVGPTAVAALDVTADAVDAVSDEIVEVADVRSVTASSIRALLLRIPQRSIG